MNEIVPRIKTMSSVELVATINQVRKEEGKAELRHATFLEKVEKVLDGDEQKFLSVYKGGNGESRKCYQLPKRECDLLVMSESYKVQAAVYDKMVELEDAKPKLSNIRMLAQMASEMANQEDRIANIEKITEIKNGLVDLHSEEIVQVNTRMDTYEARKPVLPLFGETTISSYTLHSQLSYDTIKAAVITYGINGRRVESFNEKGTPTNPVYYQKNDLRKAINSWRIDSERVTGKMWKHKPTGKTFYPKVPT